MLIFIRRTCANVNPGLIGGALRDYLARATRVGVHSQSRCAFSFIGGVIDELFNHLRATKRLGGRH